MTSQTHAPLPDRRHLIEALERCIVSGHAREQTLGLVVVKLRGLHASKVEFGREATEHLVAQIAAIIGSCLRERDSIARLSESEFALVLSEMHGAAHAELAIHRCLTRCKEPLLVDGKRIRVTLAFGVALHPDHAGGAAELLRAADCALADAIERNLSHRIYEHSVAPPAVPAGLEIALEAAIADREIDLVYQPKIDLFTQRIVGAECLARWCSQDLGQVSPDVFIGVAERTGMIAPLTTALLNTALCQARNWSATGYGIVPAVNLSAQLLSETASVDLIIQSTEIWGVGDGELTLEVTESAMMKNPAASLRTLKSLRERGFVLSIDDFGTGYSSFAYLQQLPVGELKIDKSFVLQMTDNAGATKIVKAIIDLAHHLDLKVVAEGVETVTSMESLIAMGCDFGQGYYFGKPMTAENFSAWLHESPWGVHAPQTVHPRPQVRALDSR